MSDVVNVIVEEIDDNIIIEVNPINDEVTIIIGDVVNQVGGITKHSELDLDDGTNPHGTTIDDVDDGTVAFKDEANFKGATFISKPNFSKTEMGNIINLK